MEGTCCRALAHLGVPVASKTNTLPTSWWKLIAPESCLSGGGAPGPQRSSTGTDPGGTCKTIKNALKSPANKYLLFGLKHRALSRMPWVEAGVGGTALLSGRWAPRDWR